MAADPVGKIETLERPRPGGRGHLLATFGDTQREALDRTREAALGYLEAARKEGIDVPGSDTEATLAAIEVAVP